MAAPAGGSGNERGARLGDNCEKEERREDDDDDDVAVVYCGGNGKDQQGLEPTPFASSAGQPEPSASATRSPPWLLLFSVTARLPSGESVR